MILEILAVVFYIGGLVFLIILSYLAFKSKRTMDAQTKELESFKLYLKEERQDLKNEQEKVKDRLDELRLQIGILNSTHRTTIQMPYGGAKRGPKPKNQITEKSEG